MLRDFIKNNTLAFIGLVLLLAGFIGITAFFIATKKNNTQPVTVHILPADAKATANGQEIKNGITLLEPGTYTVKASRGGFKSVETAFIVRDPNYTVIDIALEPISDSAIKWKQDNTNLYLEYEGRAGTRAAQEGEAFTVLNPITSKLPFENLLYTIGYRADPSDNSGNSIIIEIDASRGYRNAAISEIRNLGYDPTTFKINFRDYESPFDNE